MNRAFLSHSSMDKILVERIASNLGKSSCVFDSYEFENGLPILDEILLGLKSTELFVIFISNNSLNSKWVQEEISLTQRNIELGNNKKIYPILIDSNISISNDQRIPEWLKNYLMKPLIDPFIITKKIKQKLREISIESNPLYKAKEELFVGRNDVFDAFETSVFSLTDKKANSIIVSGLDGIGRRTFLKMALKRSNKIKEFYEPIYITLDTKDSIEDFILKLQDIEKETTGAFLEHLKTLTFEEKINESKKILNHIQETNEFVFVIDSGCIVQPTKRVANWYLKLVENQKFNNIFTLNIISKFRPSNELLRHNFNILHFNLTTLSDKDTEKLFVKYGHLLNLDLQTSNAKEILSLLNGLPSQIHYAIEYIKDYGIVDAIKNKYEIIDFGETQVYYMIDLIKAKGNSAFDLLVLISSFEFISYDLIYSITGQSEEVENLLDEFFILGIFDLVGANKEYIKVHFPIRDYLLRSKVKLNNTFNIKLKENIKAFITTANEEKDFNDISELLFNVKGAILEGHKLPDRYYLPSFVLKTIVDLYYKGHYRNVISLIDKVLENARNIDESLLREFNYWLCLSLARKTDPRFEIEVNNMDGSDYDYLYGFYNRFKKDFETAYRYLKKAVDNNPKFQRAKRELVNILLLKEDYSTALEISKQNYENQKLNAFHIQAYFVCLIRKPYFSKEDKEKFIELFKNIERSYDFKANEIHNVMKGEYEFYVKKDISKAINILNDCVRINSNKHFPIKALKDIYNKTQMNAAYIDLLNKYSNVTQSYTD